ncbi:MAG: DUF3280 domain-containing protein [Candidatus Binataceae bacterium]
MIADQRSLKPSRRSIVSHKESRKILGRIMRGNLTAVLAVCYLALVLQGAAALAAEPRATAVFPVELWDTSGEAAKPDQAERLTLVTNKLAALMEHTGGYRSVDLSRFTARIAATEPRYNCNGCWRDVARDAGAELAVLAVVHKVSTLISFVDLYVADLATGKYIAHADAQFRGDDDRAYVRAMEFLVNERLNRN